MIRMICIHDGKWSDGDGKGPIYMEEVNVIEIVERNLKVYYQLLNYIFDSSGMMQYFNSKWFIPCSDLDETVIHDIKPELEPETII